MEMRWRLESDLGIDGKAENKMCKVINIRGRWGLRGTLIERGVFSPSFGHVRDACFGSSYVIGLGLIFRCQHFRPRV